MHMEQKNIDLENKLVRLLNNLKFSVIRVRNHSTYPKRFHSLLEDIEYQPPLIGHKNEITYYFEFIDDPSQLDDLQTPLQKMIDLSDQKWDAEFVLVTPYGNKDTVKEWCQDYSMQVDQILEL